MAKRQDIVKHKNHKTFKVGEAPCLKCGRFLSYGGKPFTAEIKCPACGAVNVYEDSQQPKCLKDAA